MKSYKYIIAALCVAAIEVFMFFACQKEDFAFKNSTTNKTVIIQKAMGDDNGTGNGTTIPYTYTSCIVSNTYSGTKCEQLPYVKIPCSKPTECQIVYDRDGNPIPRPISLSVKEDVLLIWNHLVEDYNKGLLLVSPEEIYEQAE
ncbi:MAG: hypothetical protein KBA86_08505 [Bacteroidales bacterium]|nr:hypothetical protein [Bacteroidales bacterium]